MTRLRICRPAALLLAAVALAGCGNFVRDKETAATAMDKFRERYNAGEYDKIYDPAGPDFQSKNVRTDFLRLLDAVHHKLGNYKNCASQGWKTNSFGGDTSVELHYKTTFAEGTADEDFVYTVSGTRATLHSYRINSNALIVR